MTKRPSLALHDRSILVTGATGLVGRHLVQALAACGAEPWAVVRPGRERAVPEGIRRVVWDLEDGRPSTALPRQLAAVVHLAAPRDRLRAGLGRWAPHIRLAVDAAARLYEAARARGARQLIAASTIAAFGPRGRMPPAAAHAPFATLPAHPYAVTKRWAEDLALHARAYLPEVTIVRPGPIYGPGQSAFGLLQRIVRRLRRGETIRLASPRGRLVSPVFVGDVVHVLVASLAGPRNEILTIGGPDARHERTLVEDLAGWLGLRARVRTERRGHAANFAIDPAEIDRRFPGRPRTPWQVGMRLTWPGRGRRSRAGVS